MEGGPEASIAEWIAKRNGSLLTSDEELLQTDFGSESPASSGLSSVGSRLGDEDVMDLS